MLIIIFIFFIFPFLSMYLERDLGFDIENRDLLIGTLVILLLIYYILKNIYYKNKKTKNTITLKKTQESYDLFDNMFYSINN